MYNYSCSCHQVALCALYMSVRLGVWTSLRATSVQQPAATDTDAKVWTIVEYLAHELTLRFT